MSLFPNDFLNLTIRLCFTNHGTICINFLLIGDSTLYCDIVFNYCFVVFRRGEEDIGSEFVSQVSYSGSEIHTFVFTLTYYGILVDIMDLLTDQVRR